MKNIILLGAGEHSRVLLDIINQLNLPIVGVCDPSLERNKQKSWKNIEVFPEESIEGIFRPEEVSVINGIGIGNKEREDIFNKMKGLGYSFQSLVHPNAWISDSVVLGEGVQVMAGVSIQVDCKIGANTIVNTGANIDHDCYLGKHVNICPGAVLCGRVKVGDLSFVGAGSTLLPGIKVETGKFVKAGSLVKKNL